MNDLAVIEHKSQRVLTTAQLAEAFGTDVKRISENFTRNASRYGVGKHFFLLEGEELKSFKSESANCGIAPNINVLYLWTEKGAWMHAKSLNTDEAWGAYESLVDDYYNVKSAELDTSLLTPEMQMFHLMFQSVAKMQLDQVETRKELTAVKEVVETIQDTFLQRDEEWRDQMNSLIKSAAYRMDGDYQALYSKAYQELEERARCDLDARLRNHKTRLENAGATKTQIKNANRLDVIEMEMRLKEIFSSIVKEISIGSMRVIK